MTHREEILHSLPQLVSIPSVTASGSGSVPFGPETARALEWVLELCRSLETLAAGLAVAGCVFSEKELLSDSEYLAGKGYLELCRSKISSGHVRLRLSPAGRDYLESGDY